jgi:hypothetical protein
LLIDGLFDPRFSYSIFLNLWLNNKIPYGTIFISRVENNKGNHNLPFAIKVAVARKLLNQQLM